MESKQTGRVVLILAILAVAVYAICPQPWKLFGPGPWSDKITLKPGIDMVGGTSLLYQIETPDGGYRAASGTRWPRPRRPRSKSGSTPTASRNYIWRPQGERPDRNSNPRVGQK